MADAWVDGPAPQPTPTASATPTAASGGGGWVDGPVVPEKKPARVSASTVTQPNNQWADGHAPKSPLHATPPTVGPMMDPNWNKPVSLYPTASDTLGTKLTTFDLQRIIGEFVHKFSRVPTQGELNQLKSNFATLDEKSAQSTLAQWGRTTDLVTKAFDVPVYDVANAAMREMALGPNPDRAFMDIVRDGGMSFSQKLDALGDKYGPNSPGDIRYWASQPGIAENIMRAKPKSPQGVALQIALGMHSDLAKLKPVHPYLTGMETMALEQLNPTYYGFGELTGLAGRGMHAAHVAAEAGAFGPAGVKIAAAARQAARAINTHVPMVGDRFLELHDAGGERMAQWGDLYVRDVQSAPYEAMLDFTNPETFGGLTVPVQHDLVDVVEHPYRPPGTSLAVPEPGMPGGSVTGQFSGPAHLTGPAHLNPGRPDALGGGVEPPPIVPPEAANPGAPGAVSGATDAAPDSMIHFPENAGRRSGEPTLADRAANITALIKRDEDSLLAIDPEMHQRMISRPGFFPREGSGSDNPTWLIDRPQTEYEWGRARGRTGRRIGGVSAFAADMRTVPTLKYGREAAGLEQNPQWIAPATAAKHAGRIRRYVAHVKRLLELRNVTLNDGKKAMVDIHYQFQPEGDIQTPLDMKNVTPDQPNMGSTVLRDPSMPFAPSLPGGANRLTGGKESPTGATSASVAGPKPPIDFGSGRAGFVEASKYAKEYGIRMAMSEARSRPDFVSWSQDQISKWVSNRAPAYEEKAWDNMARQFNRAYPNHEFHTAQVLATPVLEGQAAHMSATAHVVDAHPALSESHGVGKDGGRDPVLHEHVESDHNVPMLWLENTNAVVRQGLLSNFAFHPMFNILPSILQMRGIPKMAVLKAFVGMHVPNEWIEKARTAGASSPRFGGGLSLPPTARAKIMSVPYHALSAPEMGMKALLYGSDLNKNITFGWWEDRMAAVAHHYATLPKSQGGLGMSEAASSRFLRKRLGDYENLTTQERQMGLANWAYFYTWMKTRLRAAADDLVHNPQRVLSLPSGVATANQLQGAPSIRDDAGANPTALALGKTPQGDWRYMSAGTFDPGAKYGIDLLNILGSPFATKSLETATRGALKLASSHATPAAGMGLDLFATAVGRPEVPEPYNMELFDPQAPLLTQMAQLASKEVTRYMPYPIQSVIESNKQKDPAQLIGVVGPAVYSIPTQTRMKASAAVSTGLRSVLNSGRLDEHTQAEIGDLLGRIADGDPLAIAQAQIRLKQLKRLMPRGTRSRIKLPI